MQPFKLGLLKADGVYGFFRYASMFSARALGHSEIASEAQHVYNFKKHGTHEREIIYAISRLAEKLKCDGIIACPGHTTAPSRLQGYFPGITRTTEVEPRKYNHVKINDADKATISLDASASSFVGKKVLLVDDICTTGESLRFTREWLHEHGIEADRAAVGIAERMNPTTVDIDGNGWLHAPMDADSCKTTPMSGAEREAARKARYADIGPIPPPADPARRESCRLDLPLFLRTYAPYVFTRPFSPAHLRYLAALADRMLNGGRKALAMPRGFGKTATTVGAMIWAALYGHRRYLVAVSATSDDAANIIADCLSQITGELIAADFPEAALPFIKLEGRSQRAKSQTSGGVLTRVEMHPTKLVLATFDGSHPCEGVTIQSAGLTKAVRGMHRTAPGGKWIRPDFVLLDDPQTRESANSPSQTDTRERIVNGDVMGLAGHEKDISAVMTCTVIARNDLAERFLDRDAHPEWDGQRERLVADWGPDAENRWKEYDEIWRREKGGAAENGASTAYYNSHRGRLDEGVEVLDPNLYADGETSAIQHARNLLLSVGEFAFMAEYQNDPPSLTPDADYTLTPELVMAAVSHVPRGEIPDGCEVVTAAIDVNKYAASWTAAAFDGGGAMYVIEYGFWTPNGKRELWTDNERRDTEIFKAALACARHILSRPYGEKISVLVVDAGFEARTVYAATAALRREFPHRRIYAARGLSADKYFPPRQKRGVVRLGSGAHIVKKYPEDAVLSFDSHYWHMATQRGFLLPSGAPGSSSVYGSTPETHRLFGEQVSAEVLQGTRVATNGRTYAIWSTIGRNEMSDTVAMCAAAASTEGVYAVALEAAKPKKEPDKPDAEAAPEEPPPPNPSRPPVFKRLKSWARNW